MIALLSIIRTALWAGQKSKAKEHAQIAFAQLEDYIERLEADAQALADVRTLDDWQRGQGARYWANGTRGGSPTVSLFSGDTSLLPKLFTAATPDEARAKAAAWVRGQGMAEARDADTARLRAAGVEVTEIPLTVVQIERCTCSQDNYPMWAGCKLHDFGAP